LRTREVRERAVIVLHGEQYLAKLGELVRVATLVLREVVFSKAQGLRTWDC
jgi:hypothetical protein